MNLFFSDLILVGYFFMWHGLVLLGLLYVVFGFDDLFIDVYFWWRTIWRFLARRDDTPLTYESLAQKKEQWIAVLVPCWHEASVINTMLKHNYHEIDYENYVFFVGVYPNDPATVLDVLAMSQEIKNVHCVIGKTPGPTNKAANLNGIYAYVKRYEARVSVSFEIYVFHDSEDIIHPLSFKLYNYLMPQKDMIQLPVFPLAVGFWKSTHWLYADEFSENHTKDIIVRESMGAHVPSAGVGTAFSKEALRVLEDPVSKQPFSVDSLTEDYRTSLALRMHQKKQIFLTQTVKRTRWQRRFGFRNVYVQKTFREHIATRAMFPDRYHASVRQKARWIMGIVFQEWDYTSWPKDWRVCYSLAHDRKAFVTHLLNGVGYFVFVFWLMYVVFNGFHPNYPSFYDHFETSPWVKGLVCMVMFLMFEMMLQRMIAVRGIYGWLPALLSVPRAFYGNVLNLHALLRAYRIYFTTITEKKSVKQPAWDKTDHVFPGCHPLVPYRLKFTQLVLQHTAVTPEQLMLVRYEQDKTGERLGMILLRKKLITLSQLYQVLSLQYQLPLFPETLLSSQTTPHPLPKKITKRLATQGVYLVQYDLVTESATFALSDPTNTPLIEYILRWMAPRRVHFKLILPQTHDANHPVLGKVII